MSTLQDTKVPLRIELGGLWASLMSCQRPIEVTLTATAVVYAWRWAR